MQEHAGELARRNVKHPSSGESFSLAVADEQDHRALEPHLLYRAP